MSNSTYSAAEMEEERISKIKSSTQIAFERQRSARILEEYSKEKNIRLRDYDDLSPLEQWLLSKLIER